MRGRAPERVGQRRLEVDVGDPADPVGAEEPGHDQPPLGDGEAGTTPAGEADGARAATTVTATVGGWRTRASGRPADRRSPARSWCPARGPITSRSATSGRALQSVEVGGGAADDQQHAVRHRCRTSRPVVPAHEVDAPSNERVAVTGRSVTVTVIRSSPSGTIPLGQREAHGRGDVGRGPGDRDTAPYRPGRGSRAARRRPGPSPSVGSTATEATSNPAAGRPGDDRPDRARSVTAGSGRPGSGPGGPRLHVDRAHRVPDVVDRREQDILVDADPRCLDLDRAPDADDLVDDRCRTRHRHRRRA